MAYSSQASCKLTWEFLGLFEGDTGCIERYIGSKIRWGLGLPKTEALWEVLARSILYSDVCLGPKVRETIIGVSEIIATLYLMCLQIPTLPTEIMYSPEREDSRKNLGASQHSQNRKEHGNYYVGLKVQGLNPKQ